MKRVIYYKKKVLDYELPITKEQEQVLLNGSNKFWGV